MENITIVKIREPEKYGLSHQIYGILVQSMDETAVVNFNSNRGGMTINIAHGDYDIISPDCWATCNGQVIINGVYVTGLKIWR